MSKALNPIEVGDLLKPLLLKDLRIAARSRGLNPGGNRETLMERLAEHIMETGDMSLGGEGEESGTNANDDNAIGAIGVKNNNYNRPNGQNVGNFITDRPSSRVLAPPGGGSQVTFG